MSRLSHIQRYLTFRKGSVTRHGVHSPFVFDLIEVVLRNKRSIPGSFPIERLRAELLKDVSPISKEDPGAGSSIKGTRRVKDIARHSLSSPEQCRILYRSVEFFKPKSFLEFGSCLGISTAYLALSPCLEVTSMEGQPEICAIARKNIESLGLQADIKEGLFKDTLPIVLRSMDSVDMAFIDGHHTEGATLDYYEMLKPYLTEDSILIFDDIHWSEGMERAWEALKRKDGVTLTIDLFWCGMLFFRKGLSGEHFKLRY